MIVRHLAAAPGGRMLLMVSPGFVTGDMELQTSAFIDACLRGGVVVNALDDEGLLAGVDSPESLGAPSGLRVDWATRTLGLRALVVTSLMAEAAASTGGVFFHNNNDLNAGLQTLAAPPSVSYLLGFSPSEPPNGKYHKLKVTLTNAAKYEVSARPGYIAMRPSERSESAQQRIDRVVSSNEALDQVPATVTVSGIAGKNGMFRIQVGIMLDAKRLPFRINNGVSLQELTFVTVLEDADGNYLQGKEAIMDMALSGAKRAELEAKGIKAATSFVVPKGSYRIREVIREAVHNKLAASTSPIEIAR
jgi:hypothetical protein